MTIIDRVMGRVAKVDVVGVKIEMNVEVNIVIPTKSEVTIFNRRYVNNSRNESRDCRHNQYSGYGRDGRTGEDGRDGRDGIPKYRRNSRDRC